MYNFRTDLALERRDIYQKQNKLNEKTLELCKNRNNINIP